MAEQTHEHFVPATFLPPVHCPLVLQLPGGPARAERRAYAVSKDGELEFWLPDGTTVVGRFPWTYP